jgi:hypothetical protein
MDPMADRWQRVDYQGASNSFRFRNSIMHDTSDICWIEESNLSHLILHNDTEFL